MPCIENEKGPSLFKAGCFRGSFVFLKKKTILFLKYIRWDTNMRMRYDNDFIDCHSSKMSLGKCGDLKIGSNDTKMEAKLLCSSSRTFRHF